MAFRDEETRYDKEVAVVLSKLYLRVDRCARAVCNKCIEVCEGVLLCHCGFWVERDDFHLEVLVGMHRIAECTCCLP